MSLDKALETNHLSARVGDNVEIKCDVTGSPAPPIIWLRNGMDLSTLNEDDVEHRIFCICNQIGIYFILRFTGSCVQ